MTTEDVLATLRMQAWARAKAELESVRATFYGLSKNDDYEFLKFNRFSEAMNEFILKVEDNGLAE